MITEKLLKKYDINTLDGYKKDFGNTVETEKMYYHTFLIATDHIPLKIFESFIENMATASLAETIGVVIKFFKDVKITYAEVLAARKTAREEINRIEAEMSQT